MLIKDAQINCFADVLKAVKSLTDHERHMITEIIVICNTHKAKTDKIRLLDVANEFVQRNENRFCNFGKFSDLDLSTC